MSTRCNIVVKDEMNSIQLYRHSDGYPNSEHGVVEGLKKVGQYAWDLPRFEASDFAAAIIRAMKQHGGNIYIDGTANGTKTLHGDIQYLYTIEMDEKTGAPSLKVESASCNWKSQKWTFETLFDGHIGDEFQL